VALLVVGIAGLSMASDITWAYANTMLDPLVVAVGLRLTIPLSLLGQMLSQGLFVSSV